MKSSKNYRTAKKRRMNQSLMPRYPGWTPRSFQRGEFKYQDYDLAGVVDSGAWGATKLFLLNGLNLGNTATTRVGVQVSIASLAVKLLFLNGAATDTFGRYVIFIDKQANATAPLVTDVFTAGTVVAHRNLTNRKRIRILRDKTVFMGVNNADRSSYVLNIFLKFRRPLVVDYNTADNGTIADIVTNSLYIGLIGSTAAVSNCVSAGTARIRYRDN